MEGKRASSWETSPGKEGAVDVTGGEAGRVNRRDGETKPSSVDLPQEQWGVTPAFSAEMTCTD